MKDEELIMAKTKEVGVEILDMRIKDCHSQLLIRCLIHKNKSPRWVDRYNFIHHTTTCGCLKNQFTKEDLVISPNICKDIEIVGEYVNTKTKIACRCKICGYEWLITPNKLVRGDKCPHCNLERNRQKLAKTTEQFKKELLICNPTLELVGDYYNSKTAIRYRCKICGEESISTSPTRVLTGDSGCHYCKGSIGENRIALFLKNNKIQFEREKWFKECKYKQYLYFDFYLPSYNLCIEMQGEQHFKPVDFTYTPTIESKKKAQEIFELNLIRDQIKRDFCKKQNLKLIEISYKDKNQIENILSQQLNLLL